MSKLYHQFKSVASLTIFTIIISFSCIITGIYMLIITQNYDAFTVMIMAALMYGSGAFSMLSELNEIEIEYKNGIL